METDTVGALFPQGLPDYLKGKTEPNALETDIARGERRETRRQTGRILFKAASESRHIS
jgi:hypothetical protein